MINCARYEPTIDEIMADPIVKALMDADRVNPERLRHKLLRLSDALTPANDQQASRIMQSASVTPRLGTSVPFL